MYYQLNTTANTLSIWTGNYYQSVYVNYYPLSYQ